MEKLRILILANDTTYTYNLRNELIERLVEDGHEVVVASQPLLLQEELRSLGCRLESVETNRHGTNPLSDLKLLLQLIKVLFIEKPDIALTYNIKPNIYGGIACQVTRTHYITNITGLGTAVEYPGLLQKLSMILYKLGVSKADCVFFQNEDNLAFFERHHLLRTGCKTIVLPGSGVSLKNHAKLPYMMNSEVINFLFIARILKEKGIDLYLNAAKRIYENHKNVKFHICGLCDDERYITLLNEAEKGGYIIYHGEQKNMTPFFEMAHCIVHPSYYPEGMSNVLLEAAAHCRPIIATNRAGCRETVDDGKNGLLIPIKNEDALVDAMELFLNMTWEQRYNMGLAGREKVEQEFDRQIVVDAYIKVIDTIGEKKSDRI